MANIATLGLAVESRQVRQAKGDLDKLSQSATRAEGASNQLAMATDRVEQESRQAAAAVRTQAVAQRALVASSGAAAFRQRQLAVQSLDVAQSLALGMPPMMVAIQQGGQIAGLYAGQGGVSGAFKEAASSVLGFARAHPVAIAATVALGLATLGLQNDIEATTGASVSLGNVFTATMQELMASVNGVAAPAISLLGRAFNVVANSIFDALKMVGNSIVNTFEFAYRAVVAIWDHLPEALGDLAFSAAERIASALNPILSAVNLPTIEVSNPFSGAASGMGDAMGAAYSVFENDRIGGFFERVGTGAAALAASANDAASAVGAVGTAATQAGQPMDLLGQSFNAANDNMRGWQQTFSGFFSDFSNQIQQGASVWDAFKTAGMNALNNIANKLMEMASSNLINQILGSLGSGFGGFGFGGSSSIGFGPGTALPIYHSGTNFVPETGPAILQRGEAVIPANMNRAGYSAAPSRVLIELSPDLVGTIRAQSQGDTIQIMRAATPSIVNQSVAATGGAIKAGQMDAPMGKRFGVSQTAKAR